MTDAALRDAEYHLEQLQQSWAWLALMVAPGRESTPRRAGTDFQAELLEAQGHEARAYRAINLRQGLSALPPTAAPVRLDVVDAQAAVRRTVLELVDVVARAEESSYVGGRAGMVLSVVDALEWLGEPGRGGVWVAGVDGVHHRASRLERMTGGQLSHVVGELRWADHLARAAGRLDDEEVRALEHRCPACRRRSLQLFYSGTDQRRWYVTCVSERCICRGADCGCLQPFRMLGRTHAWNRDELGGAFGLSTAIAIAEALDRGRRGRLHQSVRGHGDWADRRTEANT